MDSRWDRLLFDLEARLDAEEHAEFEAEVAQRVRAERATLTLAERLAGDDGRLRLRLLGGWWVGGCVVEAGEDWVRLGPDDGHRGYLARIPAVVEVSGLGPWARRRRPGPVGPPTLPALLRRLVADRAGVRIDEVTGQARVGTLQGVGKDHVEFAEHPADAPPRPAEVVRRVILPLSAIAGVARR